METQDVFLTDDGWHQAVAQLESLRTAGRAQVAQYLHDAKESGDVIDNAAYEEAKNQQARLEGRLDALGIRKGLKMLVFDADAGGLEHGVFSDVVGRAGRAQVMLFAEFFQDAQHAQVQRTFT